MTEQGTHTPKGKSCHTDDNCREMLQAIPLGSVNSEIRAKRTLLESLLESDLSTRSFVHPSVHL